MAGVTSNYTYDAIYQLTQVTQANNTTESYSYDAVGNRTASLGVSSYTTNASNELTATSNATYTYDGSGNTLTKTVGSNTTTYAWDYENRLTSVTLPSTGGTVSFKYDPFGRRIEKVWPTFTSIFAYDGDNPVETVNSSGTAVARYTQTQNIDEPLAELRSSTTSYYEEDGLGSVTSLTTSSGTIANTYTYDSDGKLTASSGSVPNPISYTGREFDSETGLYYYRARYYDPSVGRFIAEDPIQFAGGMNFYSYVSNNPVEIRDPLGLCPDANKPTFTKRYLPPGARRCLAILPFNAPPEFDLNAIVAAGKAGGLLHADASVGHYGTFDFQRVRDSAGNTIFYSGYTDASNIAVGAYLYGAGYSEEDASTIANTFALWMSSNAGSPQQAVYRNLGYDLAAAGWSPTCTVP